MLPRTDTQERLESESNLEARLQSYILGVLTERQVGDRKCGRTSWCSVPFCINLLWVTAYSVGPA